MSRLLKIILILAIPAVLIIPTGISRNTEIFRCSVCNALKTSSEYRYTFLPPIPAYGRSSEAVTKSAHKDHIWGTSVMQSIKTVRPLSTGFRIAIIAGLLSILFFRRLTSGAENLSETFFRYTRLFKLFLFTGVLVTGLFIIYFALQNARKIQSLFNPDSQTRNISGRISEIAGKQDFDIDVNKLKDILKEVLDKYEK
ncbi:MAG: hypothetical protein JXJ19_00210 [Elusimicrobia bacterium]|nr:hypothetical protein [Elusimicrobiota bacterium]